MDGNLADGRGGLRKTLEDQPTSLPEKPNALNVIIGAALDAHVMGTFEAAYTFG